MLSTGANSSGYHRLDAGPSSAVSQHAAAATNGTSQNPVSMPSGQSTRASSQQAMAPSSSTPFPIAPAPQHMMQPPPMMPYSQQPPPPPPSMHMAPPASQSQIVCTGCRTLLVYPNNATNVRCAVCSTITPVPPAGTEMAQLVCGGCRTLLMYVRGASSVQCSCCHTVNLSMETNQVAHINCGGCNMTLMYAYGAQSVKCAVCQFVTSVGVAATRMPLPMQRPPYSQPSQMVVVENPMTLDESGKLVNNVAVGLTEQKT